MKQNPIIGSSALPVLCNWKSWLETHTRSLWRAVSLCLRFLSGKKFFDPLLRPNRLSFSVVLSTGNAEEPQKRFSLIFRAESLSREHLRVLDLLGRQRAKERRSLTSSSCTEDEREPQKRVSFNHEYGEEGADTWGGKRGCERSGGIGRYPLWSGSLRQSERGRFCSISFLPSFCNTPRLSPMPLLCFSGKQEKLTED